MDVPTVICLDLPASTDQLNVLCACLDKIIERVDGLAEPDVTSYNLQLAANEIMVNVIRHAYRETQGGRIAITCTLERAPRRLTIDMYDTGCSFDPSQVPLPDLEEAQIHGYGLFLVEQLVDELVYETGPNGNHWRLLKNL